ncbi:hypothetical protein DL765_008342 [Monosporascus sp. GIB2]|nr:hypothetical protein DL765_008342 [Monosporascus sp. GIB2]
MAKLHKRKTPMPLYRPPKWRGLNFKHNTNGRRRPRDRGSSRGSQEPRAGVVTTQQARAEGRTARTARGQIDERADEPMALDVEKDGLPLLSRGHHQGPAGLGRVLERRLRLVSLGARDRSSGSGYGHPRPCQRRPPTRTRPPPQTGTPSSAHSWRASTGWLRLLRERCPECYPDAAGAGESSRDDDGVAEQLGALDLGRPANKRDRDKMGTEDAMDRESMGAVLRPLRWESLVAPRG